LHLDGWVIEGLESGNYARIGPAVYVKGHLKRYAELLGLPADEILANFEGQPLDEIPPPAPAMRVRTSPSTGNALPWARIVGVAVIAALVAGGLWLWHPWHPRSAAGVPAKAADTLASAAAPPGATSDAQGASAGSGSEPAAPSASDPVAGAGRARLRLLFLADSWVDVHDAAGQRLFAGNGHANNVRSMSGAAPLRVYIKSASSVHLDINNHAVVIGPQFIIDNVAHFEAGADGVLRRDPKIAPPNGGGPARVATPGGTPSGGAPPDSHPRG
jgi:cytoskeleton protein RodZ